MLYYKAKKGNGPPRAPATKDVMFFFQKIQQHKNYKAKKVMAQWPPKASLRVAWEAHVSLRAFFR